MKTICPNCGNDVRLIPFDVTEEIIVRDERIMVSIQALRCENCGEEFFIGDAESDVLDSAYREYRKKHSMLQPEEIREFRNRFGLTQQELARLLGWGGATISRYENGALQDLAHDKVLHLVMDPRNLKKLMMDNQSLFSEEKQKKLALKLSQITEREIAEVKTCYEDLLGSYPPDQFSGYLRLDIQKLTDAILFMCMGNGVLKTNLNKLLFYADFIHYKEYASSITGARYVHLTYGPVLDNYEFFLATLIHEDKSLKVEEQRIHDYYGEVHISNISPDLRSFSNSEMRVLAQVKERFEDFTALQIKELSHMEKGYLETSELEFISYEYADAIEF